MTRRGRGGGKNGSRAICQSGRFGLFSKKRRWVTRRRGGAEKESRAILLVRPFLSFLKKTSTDDSAGGKTGSRGEGRENGSRAI